MCYYRHLSNTGMMMMRDLGQYFYLAFHSTILFYFFASVTACLPERRLVTEGQYLSGNTDDEGYVCQLACLNLLVSLPRYIYSQISHKEPPPFP